MEGSPVIHAEPAEFFGDCGGRSFVTQGYYGIDAHRPPGRNKASHKCYGSNHEHDGRKGDWIVRADIKEKAGDETASKKCRDHPCSQAYHDWHHPLAKHHAEQIMPRGTERHADAQFLATPLDGVSDHAENSERGEKERADGEKQRKKHLETARIHGFGNYLRHGTQRR